ncbi:MAG: L-serine ammonia-lyase, iron-sulfur-dependent subunit beta [Bacillota bacterium]|nr:L-serine ammonia-lyase, iron-sulfur-dependent subunit beta [Bacillota bacterium]
MNIFDILGPVMVGPSSSHTAGAARIGLIARQLLGCTPEKAEIYLHGSFADTGKGHGTDRALVAGLLGMEPDDPRIPVSFDAAGECGMEFTISETVLRDAHPNTARLILHGKDGRRVDVQASSLGGGRIQVNKLDGMDVCFSGNCNTLIIYNEDRPGLVADVSSLLASVSVNIGTLQLFRDKRGGTAVMVYEIDHPLSPELVQVLEQFDGILKATYINVKL